MAKRHEDLTIPEGTSPTQAFVQILDPATGTGTFLVEVIDLIHNTIAAKWKSQGHGEKKVQRLWNEYVPKHLLPRLHGYELLMAPYAIAHLKIGLKLFETGYRFESDERARVYLTNALEPPGDGQLTLDFLPALAHEVEAVDKIKRGHRFTVVIGNPPYSKLSQNKGEWIDGLMERYKTTIKSGEIQRQALSNDYVKFVCFSSSILVEKSSTYVIGMITDNSYLDGPLFRDMRADLLATYCHLYLTDLGGNSRRVDASIADQNVFEIQQGVSVVVGATHPRLTDTFLRYRAVRGSRDEKTAWLMTHSAEAAQATDLSPAAPQFYFIPYEATAAHWGAWPAVSEAFAGGVRRGRPLPFNGAALATRHDAFAIAFTEKELRENLRRFFDASETYESLNRVFRFCSSSHFNFRRARTEVTHAEALSCVRPILYRPFDVRYVAFHAKLIGEPRPEVMRHLLAGSLALLSTRRVTGRPYDNVFVCRGLVEYKAVTHDRNTQVFPLYLVSSDESLLFTPAGDGKRHVNIAPSVFEEWQESGGVGCADELLAAIYALLFSPEYRRQFHEKLQQDYARVPVPVSEQLGCRLASCGSELISLHLLESPKLDEFITTYTGPGNPKVGRVGWSDGTVWLDAGKTSAREGHRATEPGTIGFQGVPEQVWDFHIGGYQVCHKWLKDRKGRILSDEEVAHYQKIVVALSETIRIMAEIDEVIEAHGGWPDAFQTGSEPAEEKPALLKVAESSPPYRPRRSERNPR